MRGLFATLVLRARAISLGHHTSLSFNKIYVLRHALGKKSISVQHCSLNKLGSIVGSWRKRCVRDGDHDMLAETEIVLFYFFYVCLAPDFFF